MWGRHLAPTSDSRTCPRPTCLTCASHDCWWGIIFVDVDIELDKVLSKILFDHLILV